MLLTERENLNILTDHGTDFIKDNNMLFSSTVQYSVMLQHNSTEHSTNQYNTATMQNKAIQ